MADRLISSETLLKAYDRDSVQTLMRWTKREDNPLPAPINGGRGKGNKYKWFRSDLAAWELKEYGREIEMG